MRRVRRARHGLAGEGAHEREVERHAARRQARRRHLQRVAGRLGQLRQHVLPAAHGPLRAHAAALLAALLDLCGEGLAARAALLLHLLVLVAHRGEGFADLLLVEAGYGFFEEGGAAAAEGGRCPVGPAVLFAEDEDGRIIRGAVDGEWENGSQAQRE